MCFVMSKTYPHSCAPDESAGIVSKFAKAFPDMLFWAKAKCDGLPQRAIIIIRGDMMRGLFLSVGTVGFSSLS